MAEELAQLRAEEDKADEIEARMIAIRRRSGGDVQFSTTLYDLISAYARRRNKQTRRRKR